jgi:4-hydroxybenzoate polyprenyltransferase
VAAAMSGGRLVYFLALAFSAVQLSWQVATLDTADPANCLARFRSNQLVGWALFLAAVIDMGLVALFDAA